jgi:hypothetical protein
MVMIVVEEPSNAKRNLLLAVVSLAIVGGLVWAISGRRIKAAMLGRHYNEASLRALAKTSFPAAPLPVAEKFGDAPDPGKGADVAAFIERLPGP